jgi:hypothetical protein
LFLYQNDCYDEALTDSNQALDIAFQGAEPHEENDFIETIESHKQMIKNRSWGTCR